MISLLKRRHLPPINPPLHLHLKHFLKPQELSNPNPFLPLLHSCPDLSSLKQIHALLVVHGLIQNLPLSTKLASSYCAFETLESARKVFDEIPNPDLYSWKVMLRWYVVSDRYAEAIGFYGRRMRLCLLVEDNVVFSLVLKACAKSLDIDEGKKVHGHVVKVGDPDCFVLNCLVDMYAKCGDIECARRVFDQIPDRNVVSWTSIVCGYVQNGRAEEGLVLFNAMRRESVEPSEHTLASLLTACTTLDALRQGKWIHGYGIKVGVSMNAFVGTALLDMYVKCGDVTHARDVFNELYNVDIISWTAMIVGYTQTGRPLEALGLFVDKNFAGIIPNSITIASVLSASAQIKNLNFGRSIHVLGIKLGVENSSVVVNSLVDMYAKCCALSDASRIFKGSQNKDVITWNSMITGCVQNDLGYEALSLFNRMRLVECSPDAVTLVSTLSASASLGAIQVGSTFHGYALKCAFLFNIYVNTALLNLYNKCGDLVSSRKVFDEMSDRNAVTLCAMMGGYGMQGDSASSMDLFKEMLNEDFRPNDITFTSILSTCSHTGMITEGQKYFDTMLKNYEVAPSMKHYACMVDMLSRAGKLAEALEFIEKMPFKADVRVWGAFLHGCTLYSNFDLGEVAVSRIMELQPESSDYYVLMFNLYASHARWAEAMRIRDLMKERGMVKLPGFSSVGMENGLQNSVPSEHISQEQVHDRKLG